jgi:hypothetical protein
VLVLVLVRVLVRVLALVLALALVRVPVRALKPVQAPLLLPERRPPLESSCRHRRRSQQARPSRPRVQPQAPSVTRGGSRRA